MSTEQRPVPEFAKLSEEQIQYLRPMADFQLAFITGQINVHGNLAVKALEELKRLRDLLGITGSRQTV